jgi:DNA repair exonuclease SbcCD nuclease subunit
MLKIGCIGDLHLEALTRKFSYEEGLSLQMDNLERQVKFFDEQGCDELVFLGDIFDTPNPNDKAYTALIDFLNSCETTYPYIMFRMIAGNHDVRNNEDCSLDLLVTLEENGKLPNCKIYLKPKTVKVRKKYKISFQSWANLIPPEEPCLVFAHLALNGVKTPSGYSLKTKYELSDLKSHYVIGDIHTYQSLASNILYPGTSGSFSFGEPEKKSVTILEYHENGKIDNIDLDWIPSWHLLDVDIEPAKPKSNCRYRIRTSDVDSELLYDVKKETNGSGFDLESMIHEQIDSITDSVLKNQVKDAFESLKG